MENSTSLDDILGGDEAPEQEAQSGPIRDEHGRFASAEQQPQPEEMGDSAAQPLEGPPPSEPETGHIPIAALKDERYKRQAAEQAFNEAQQRLAQYEAYFAQANQQQAPQEEEDPVEYLTQQIASRLGPQVQQQQFLLKVEVAEQFARQQWADYDTTVDVFKDEAGRNPHLWAAVQQAPNPAQYAYNAGKNILAARTYGSEAPPSRDQIEAEIREKIMAEIGVNRPNVPTSLANAQSRGSRGGPAWSGPASLDSILGS
jgi:hypothetical protein